MATRVRIHMTVVNQILNVVDVPDFVLNTTFDVFTACVQECPVDTGSLVRSHRVGMSVSPFVSVTGTVSNSDEAALWVHEGTGIYSRRGSRRRIRPRTARFLRFPARHYPSADGWVYARSVSGQRPDPWMWRGLRQGTRGRQRWRLTRY